MSQSFKIIAADTLGCKIHITDNALRSEASSYDLISSHLVADENDPTSLKRAERASVIPLMDLLSAFDAARERMADCGEELDPKLAALVECIEGQRGKIVALAKSALLNAELTWELIPHAFSKGDEIAVILDDARHGAEIVRAVQRSSFFGTYIALTYRFQAFDGTRARWATATKNIPSYQGGKGQDQLGLRLMTPELAAELEAAGRVSAGYSMAPSYLQYEGSLARKSWRGATRYRAGGRAMIDLRSMKEMDPDYSSFYGSFDDDDEDAPSSPDIGAPLDAKSARLFTPYVYGFSFLCKAWGEMLATGMSQIAFREEAFDQLVLEPSRKRLIHALVSQSQGKSFSDVIEGKGGGCIFLLHGQPGVGKTLTAEAIAERMRRPLYMVGAGELGITPDELEERLKSVLDIAHSWNAVLLIDEADIFLERRGQSDVTRNAMVGIFLRLLEYHQGVLFLTTNRVADIDEAFMSRVSVGLHYEALGEPQRAQIWRNLLEASKSFDMGAIRFDELGQLPINGRQIKHCIRMALAICASESRPATCDDLFDMAHLAMEFKNDFAKAQRPEA